MKQLCFVLMPFGIKTDGNKKEIDFDKVYKAFIKEAIIMAGLEPIRADEEKAGGFIHKPMYERLMFCDFAVADLSFANANVFYELGIRHALKPYTTISIFEVGTKLPFDTAPLRTFPYSYENGEIKGDKKQLISSLAEMIKVNLKENSIKTEDSPIAQLITGYHFPDLTYLRDSATSFADAALRTKNIKTDLRQLTDDWNTNEASKRDESKTQAESDEIDKKQEEIKDKIAAVAKANADGLQYNYNLLYALIEACKNTGMFNKLIEILQPFADDTDLKKNVYIQQQLALAYNKCNPPQRLKAETILKAIIQQYGPDPETNGLLGSVYKGMANDSSANKIQSAGFQSKATDTYLEGFEADPRDYYPGINALTLMFLGNKPDDRFDKYMILVKYAVERALRSKSGDYWVQATAMELEVLSMNEDNAIKLCGDAIACSPEVWMRKSTADNLMQIYQKVSATSSVDWLKDIINELKPGTV